VEGISLKTGNTARGRSVPANAPDRLEPIKLARSSELDLAAVGKRVRLRVGQKLPLPREDADAVYALGQGMISLQAQWEHSERFVLSFLTAGEALGASLVPPRVGACLVAAVPCEVHVFSKATLPKLAEPGASVARDLMRVADVQAARMALHVIMIAGLTAEQRVATLLVDLALRLRLSEPARASIEIPFSRSEMADYLGLNADTLSRVMSHLRAKGLFQQPRRDRILLSNWIGLVGLCPVIGALENLSQQAKPLVFTADAVGVRG
jgi:CRP/FNR family transcriptional regulator